MSIAKRTNVTNPGPITGPVAVAPSTMAKLGASEGYDAVLGRTRHMLYIGMTVGP
jgi:hypothetical protein